MQETILVLSSNVVLSGLIARTLRYRRIYCMPIPLQTKAADLLLINPRGIIIALPEGNADLLAQLDLGILTSGIPIFALGSAAISLCEHFGGTVDDILRSNAAVSLELSSDPLFDQINSGERVLRSLCALSLPADLTAIAKASDDVIGFKHATLPIYALQYSIERNDPDSAQLLFNFAHGICTANTNWDEDLVIDTAVDQIRSISGSGRVICAISGGLDSAVCAKLASLAVSDRLVCLFVDTGLLRLDEAQSVIDSYRDIMGIEVEYIDAKDSFLHALAGVTSASDKKRITSSLMTQILLKHVQEEEQTPTLVMGTNLNDTISGFAQDNPIQKSKGDMQLNIYEPLLTVFKEEVIRIATTIGMPPSITQRKPFPLSGLALRISGEVTQERLNVLRAAEACFMSEIRQGDFQKRLWQYYTSLIEDPDHPKSYMICLRALQSAQGGKYAARLPFDLLERTTNRIRAEVPGISRVVYDLTPSTNIVDPE